MTSRPRLGVNIDHVATIRNARGGVHPDPRRGDLRRMAHRHVAGAFRALVCVQCHHRHKK